MIGRVEPLPSWHPDFHLWLKDVLRRHQSSLSAVKTSVHRHTAYGKPASHGQLDSIHAGRRTPSAQHLLQIAEAIGAPEEFVDYNRALVLYLLSPDLHADEQVLAAADALASTAAKLPGSKPSVARRARKAAQRLDESQRASTGTRRARGGKAPES